LKLCIKPGHENHRTWINEHCDCHILWIEINHSPSVYTLGKVPLWSSIANTLLHKYAELSITCGSCFWVTVQCTVVDGSSSHWTVDHCYKCR
jgi:hypothetical protein